MLIVYYNVFGTKGMPMTLTHRAAQEECYGTPDFTRPPMGTHRTDPSPGQAAQEQRSPARCEPESIDRHSIRLAHRDSMGVLAPGDGMRQRHDLLATPARLAASGGVAGSSRSHVGEAEPSRCDRLVSRGSGQRIGTRRFWGPKTGPNPTDRRKLGSKHHILTDAQGIPLSVTLTGANAHDVTQLLPLVEAISPVRGKRGRPRQRPESLQADRGYDSEPHRKALRKMGIRPQLAKRRTANGSGLGKTRWVVERTLAWLHDFRRLRVRYEKRADIHEAFLTLGCILICFNFINRFC